MNFFNLWKFSAFSLLELLFIIFFKLFILIYLFIFVCVCMTFFSSLFSFFSENSYWLEKFSFQKFSYHFIWIYFNHYKCFIYYFCGYFFFFLNSAAKYISYWFSRILVYYYWLIFLKTLETNLFPPFINCAINVHKYHSWMLIVVPTCFGQCIMNVLTSVPVSFIGCFMCLLLLDIE